MEERKEKQNKKRTNYLKIDIKCVMVCTYLSQHVPDDNNLFDLTMIDVWSPPSPPPKKNQKNNCFLQSPNSKWNLHVGGERVKKKKEKKKITPHGLR